MNRKKLIHTIFERQSFLCVGLDTEILRLPVSIERTPSGVLDFNKKIIDATREFCVAYKPNLAFYEALGPEGWRVFAETVAYIGHDHLIIADAKRGDIGNTSRMYADAFFNQMGCDAITVAPYMGEDSVTPFIKDTRGWVILLALTSNPGSSDFQQLSLPSGELLYEKVIREATQWADPDRLMFVAGATHPEHFKKVRQLAPDYFLLVPGVGAQGGDLDTVCQYGFTSECGLLINASRSIIYASGGTDFAEKARAEARRMQQQMAPYCQH